jgi:hypothetical protein
MKRDVSEEPAEWRWADADGAQLPIDEWDLVGSLSNGSLPPYTLVWRKGWADWLPACQVGELSSALPAGQAEAAVAPTLDATVTEPPAPPLERYKAKLTRDAAAKLLGKSKAGSVTRQSAPPPPPPGAQLAPDAAPPPAPKVVASAAASLMGRVGAFAAAPPPPPPPPFTAPPPSPPMRPPVPTLIEMTPLPATGTLRPTGGVPPPPRNMPPIPRIPEELEAMILGQTVPGPTLPGLGTPLATATPLPTVVITEKRESGQSPRDQPTGPRASPEPLPPPAEDGALPSWSEEVDAAIADEAPAPPPVAPTPTAPVVAPPPSATSSLLMLALGGIAVLLAIAVVALVLARREPAQTTPPVVVGPSAKIVGESAPPTALPAPICTREKRPKRIATSIVQGIPPYVSNVPSSPRLAIGIATSKTAAAGLTLDVTSLDAARTFDDTGKRAIVGVVPTTSGGKLAFVVDRDDAPLRYSRTIDAPQPFALGMTKAGFARAIGEKDPTALWPGGADEKMTEIRVATVPGVGHAVTFRRGGQSGKVMVGWLAPDGSRKSDLTAITSQRYIGTPTLAANEQDVLVAFAARPSEDAYWTVQLAAAKHGEVPREGKPFAIPPGGPGSEAISPAAAGLAKGRWFVQWTEGSTGQRQVRGQVVGSDLNPIGGALILSAENTNAGQGVVWTQGEHVVSLFLVSKGRGHELWGATLKCP